MLLTRNGLKNDKHKSIKYIAALNVTQIDKFTKEQASAVGNSYEINWNINEKIHRQ